VTALAFGLHGGIELTEKADLAFVAEADHVASREPFGGLHERTPARAVETLVQCCLDRWFHCAAANAPAAQPGSDHFGVIDHKRIACAQQVGEIAHAAIIQFRRRARTYDQ
jgi:hypothetical protein